MRLISKTYELLGHVGHRRASSNSTAPARSIFVIRRQALLKIVVMDYGAASPAREHTKGSKNVFAARYASDTNNAYNGRLVAQKKHLVSMKAMPPVELVSNVGQPRKGKPELNTGLMPIWLVEFEGRIC
jgi:hypothetical protein